MNKIKQREARLSWAIYLIVGFAFIAVASAILLPPYISRWRMQGMFDTLLEDGEPQWRLLDDWNEDVCAWLRVGNTAIETPVMRGKGEYWLWRDPWGNWSSSGTPYLQDDCDPDNGTQIVLGHHFLNSDLAFSELYDKYHQESFDTLGSALWYTRDGGMMRLVPLCSMRVLYDYKPVQKHEFEGTVAMREWLRGEILPDASAQAENAGELISRATRTVTLVTCSELTVGQPWRCLTVFIAVD